MLSCSSLSFGWALDALGQLANRTTFLGLERTSVKALALKAAFCETKLRGCGFPGLGTARMS